MGSSRGVAANVLDCRTEENEFKLQSDFDAHFWTYALGKGMKPAYPPAVS